MRILAAAVAIATLVQMSLLVLSPPAAAQAVCRQKCTAAEEACLKRTFNKSQCGGKAQACLAKCK